MDNNTPYIVADNINDLIKSLEETSTALFQCFNNNFLERSSCKFHLLICSNENIRVKIGFEIANEIASECEKLLGVKLDWKLNFDDRIFDICKTVNGKLNA